MKKKVLFMMMFVMLFSFSITAHAEKSPSGTPTTEKNTRTEVSSPVSPKTGDEAYEMYGLGGMAVVCAAGAMLLRKKAV